MTATTASSEKMNPQTDNQPNRLAVLDGWRGISILCILATHMLPLGPKILQFNSASGLFGMSLFFTLSGFLITLNLYKRQNTINFFIRRFSRILPLAYLYLVVAFLIQAEPFEHFLANLLFSQNYLHYAATPKTSHFWSLCVEIHFYIGIGLLMCITRFRGFKLLPLILVCLVANRIYLGVPYNIKTHLRVDEIISGACLALIFADQFGEWLKKIIRTIPWYIWLGLLCLASHEATKPFMYFRGIFASCLIGHTLLTSSEKEWSLLESKPLKYLAEISYALYVWHPITMYGWLGEGETKIIKYLKRPLCFVLSFGAAHLSTHYYEMPITRFGRNLTKKLDSWRNNKPLPLSGNLVIEPQPCQQPDNN